MKIGSTNFTQEFLVEVTRFLLVLVKQFPIAVARLTSFALVFALLNYRLFGRLIVRLFVFNKLLIAQERVAAQLANKWPDVDVL